jgi:Flp pilus assembly protein TadG
MSTNVLQPSWAVLGLNKGRERVAACATGLTKLASGLRDDKSGSTMIIFGLTMMPVMFFVGMSVDFSRMLTAKAQSLAMADAAGLAAGRSFQTGAEYTSATAPAGSKVTCTPGTGLNKNAETAACNFLRTTLSQNVVSTVVDFPATTNSAEFTVRTTSWVKTPFLGIGEFTGHRAADSSAPTGCTTNGWQCQKVVSTSTVIAASGGNSDGINIEVSMMIDVTGSMDESDGAGSTKIATVKKAAGDAVNILIWDDQSKFTSKVALAPFSQRVNVGSYMTAVTGLPATNASGKSLRPCVTERTGVEAYTDAAPGTGNWIGSYVGQPSAGTNSATDTSNYNSSGTCSSGNDPSATMSIIPLTSNKTTLKDEIALLDTSNTTAGHLGTAWAWYLISPNWAGIWPAGSTPGAYDKSAKPSLKKYAILMTDGDYNTQYTSTNSKTQAGNLCTNMKTAGVEVYTIGAQVSDNAKTFLKSCATDNNHYYDATDGVKLQAAFRDIALKISSLRVAR